MDFIKSKIFRFFHKTRKKIVGFLFYLRSYKKNKGQISVPAESFDKRLVYSLSSSKIPSLEQVKHLKKVWTVAEKKKLVTLSAVIFISLIILGASFYKAHLQLVPIVGGEYSEAVVGLPAYINPLYSSVNDVDSDLVQLIFSGLMRYDNNSNIVNDLAKTYNISEDGRTYTFKIRENVKWHNGEELTADDIVFTFKAIQDPSYRSPWHNSFLGVGVEKVDTYTVKFILPEAYAAFLELMTIGILPQAIWSEISPASASLAELNIKPIGSGPYKFKSFAKDKAGVIKEYDLVLNDDYYRDGPFIKIIKFKFFPTIENAINILNRDEVDGLSYLPLERQSEVVAPGSLTLYKFNLPQLSAIFFNSAADARLKEKKFRQALALGIDREAVIKSSLGGNAALADGPILAHNFAYNSGVTKYNYDPTQAIEILDGLGWKRIEINQSDLDRVANLEDVSVDDQIIKDISKLAVDNGLEALGTWRYQSLGKNKGNDYLLLELDTVDSNLSLAVAAEIKAYWDKLGVRTIIKATPAKQILNDIVKPRKFSVLLYSLMTGSDPDSYAFWHSSQINQSGLNLASYDNEKVDKLLEDARLTNDINVRIEKYGEFQKIVSDDIPAVFLYSPFYVYPQSKKIKGVDTTSISTPSLRFANITNWYIKAAKKIVW